MNSTEPTLKKDDKEDEEDIKCIECEKVITGKPWITVHYDEDDYTVYACRYLCAKDLRFHLGCGYWKNVVNKEDFNKKLIPIISKTDLSKDITTNFQKQEIIDEIIKDDIISSQMEESYYYTEDDY